MCQTLYRMNEIYLFDSLNHLLFGIPLCQICPTNLKLYLYSKFAFDFCLVVWNSWQLLLHLNNTFPIASGRVMYKSAWEGLIFDPLNNDD